MKNVIRLTLAVLVSASAFLSSCKNKKEASATVQQPAPAPTPAPVNQPAQSEAAKSENIRFVVSFYSIGQGIDGKLHDEFVKFLTSYPKKIKYEPTAWGREGEVDYCLALTELTAVEQDEFIRKAKNIVTKRVHINEEAPCSHKKPAGNPDEKYRLTLSFYSIGEGINTSVLEKFEKFLSGYTPKISYEPVRWGREGEVDYCLKLTELSAAQQEEFVMKTKEIAGTLVHVNENAKCVHKH